MSAAFEWGVEEGGYAFKGFLLADETAGHHEDVGVVVLAGEFGYLGLPAEGAAYAFVVVHGHIDAVTGAADGYAALVFACFDGGGEGVTEFGVVTAVGAVGSVVFVAVAFGGEPLFYLFFEGVACVVACESYYFVHLVFCFL